MAKPQQSDQAFRAPDQYREEERALRAFHPQSVPRNFGFPLAERFWLRDQMREVLAGKKSPEELRGFVEGQFVRGDPRRREQAWALVRDIGQYLTPEVPRQLPVIRELRGRVAEVTGSRPTPQRYNGPAMTRGPQPAAQAMSLGEVVQSTLSSRGGRTVATDYRALHGTPAQRAAEVDAEEEAARQGKSAPPPPKERQVETGGRRGAGTLRWKEAQNAPLAQAERERYNRYQPYFLKGLASGVSGGLTNYIWAPPDPRDADARLAFEVGVPIGALAPGAAAERAVGWAGRAILGEVRTAARLATETAAGAAGDAASAYSEGAAQERPTSENIGAAWRAAATSPATGAIKHAAKEGLRTIGAPRPRSPRDPDLPSQYDPGWASAEPANPRAPQPAPRPTSRPPTRPATVPAGAPQRPVGDALPKASREAGYPAKRKSPRGMHQHDREQARRTRRDR